MVPYAFGSSDGLFNLGSALSFVQVLPPGVYVAMNGQHFPWDAVRKNKAAGVFEEPGRRGSRHEPTAAALAAAVGRHQHLHGDVEAGGRGRRRSTCRRDFRISTAIRR